MHVERDAAADLAAFAARLRYDDLPAAVVTRLKAMVLDTIGTTLAATTLAPAAAQLIGMTTDVPGAPQATLLGCGARVPTLMAALVNGALAHALNYDDIPGPSAVHLGPTSVPAALAAAEHVGGIDGRGILVALAAGTEVGARVGLAARSAEQTFTQAKPQPTQMPGYFGAAVCAGSVMRLSEEHMLSALGLAVMQAAGDRQPVLEGTPSKAIYTGFSVHGGMLSALLAWRGLSGSCAVLEGEAGLYNTFYGGRYTRSALVDGLGERFSVLEIGFKPWPTTAVAHPFIEAALQLRSEHAVDPRSIERVRVRGGDRIRTYCEPRDARRRPSSPVQAEDSIFFATATALANGSVTLGDLQPEGLVRPEVLRIAAVTDHAVERSLGRAGILEVDLRGGRSLRARVDAPLGEPVNPLSHERLVAKFRDCAGHARVPIADSALGHAIDLIGSLEEVRDVRSLVDLFGGRAS